MGKPEPKESLGSTLAVDSSASAKKAGLRYANDTKPGIRRALSGKKFIYFDTDDNQIRDKETLERIESLVLPPAWVDVWISPRPDGHLQATGKDSRGRKQYRYHPEWNKIRNQTKYYHIVDFAELLPKIRKHVTDDLGLPGISKAKIIATAIRVLDATAIRIGNEQYAKENESYGLTTLRSKHVKIKGTGVQFEFKGKSGVYHTIDIADPKVSKIIRRVAELPGWELFQYVDEKEDKHSLDSQDINDYLTEIAGKEFTAKDFRTWAGSVEAAVSLFKLGPQEDEVSEKKNIVQAIRSAAELLGNRPATCRKYYVHPAVLESYKNSKLFDYFADVSVVHNARGKSGLSNVEEAVLEIIKDQAKSAS